MWDTTITITRGGTTLVGTDGRNATGIFCQVDQASDKEQFEMREIYSFQGNNLYKIYVPWQPNSLIREEDLLIDERVTDPDRNGGTTLYRYRVVGRPKNYLYDHQKLYCTVEVGT